MGAPLAVAGVRRPLKPVRSETPSAAPVQGISGRFTIHVVDATRDLPAAGLRVDVYVLGGNAAKLCHAEVGEDGLITDPAINGPLEAGEYEVMLHIGDYYRRLGHELPAIPLLDAVPFRVGIACADVPVHLRFRIAPRRFSLACATTADCGMSAAAAQADEATWQRPERSE